jgi:prephenate dehydratase
LTTSKIAFQGDYGSNSHELCVAHFPNDEPVPCATFAEAFSAVRSGACSLGVIAIENSIAGRVGDVHHLLPSSGLKIVGERFKPIRFHLMANPGVALEDVREVSSHVMALGQCRQLIQKLGLRATVAGDTAGAARELSERPNPHHAAIAPELAAELYGLTILARDIEDEPDNTTRFLVMTGDPNPAEPPAGVDCLTSLIFHTRDVPAALYKALGGFASNGVNLIKLESYIDGSQFTPAQFYAEIEGRPSDPGVALALEELAFFSGQIELLGVYPADAHRRPQSPSPAALSAAASPAAPSTDEDDDWKAALVEFRRSIDNIDAALIHVLAERFKCTRKVGALKSRYNLPPADPKREAQQIERLRNLALAADLDPRFAEKFLNFIIAEVIRHHEAAAKT